MTINLDDYMAALPEDRRTAIKKRAAELREGMALSKSVRLSLDDATGDMEIDRDGDLVAVRFKNGAVALELALTAEEARKLGAAILAAGTDDGEDADDEP